MRQAFSRTFTAKKAVLVERAKITDITLTVKFPTVTCSSATKGALLETDPSSPDYATTRLGNEGHVKFTWVIVD